MKLAATQLLFDHWTEIRGARSAPEREEIEPRAIAGVLADTFILDFDPPAGFPMRVAGSRTQALFQREIRDRPFLELWRRADRAELTDILSSVADETLPFLLGAVGGPAGMDRIDFEILLAPLRHHGATHARVLGACAPAHSFWSVPRKLTICPTAECMCRGGPASTLPGTPFRPSCRSRRSDQPAQ